MFVFIAFQGFVLCNVWKIDSCVYSHSNYISLYVLPVLAGIVLSLSFLFSGPGMQAPRGVWGCRDEQLWLYSPLDAAEHWHCRSLFYVKEDRCARGKDTMCWPGWQEVRATGEDNKRLLGVEAISKYELKSSHVSSLSQVLTHIALMAAARALAFWKGKETAWPKCD